MSEVWDSAPVKGGALLFLLALADQAGDEDRCAWPGAKQLQIRARAGRSTVYEYAALLEQKRVIERVEGDDRPLRYRRMPGRETTVWRIRPTEDWVMDEASEEGVQKLDPSGGPDPRGPVGRTPGVRLSGLEASSNHQENPPTTRVGRRRRREQEQLGSEEQPVGSLPDDAPPAPVAAPKKPTPTKLATYFRRWAQLAYPMWPESSGEAPLARHISRWVNADAIPVEQVAEAMELFMADERFHRAGQPLWKSFVNSHADLANRVRGRAGLPPAQPVERVSADTTPRKGQKVDYKEWKAEQLRKAGRTA